MRLNQFAAIVLSAFFFMVAAGCNSNDADQSVNNKADGRTALNGADEMVVITRQIPASLDAVVPNTCSMLRRIGAVEALFVADHKAEIVPSLAEKAEKIDASTWEIKLRPGIRFWSGKEMDAAAVVASLERSKKIDLQALPFLQDLTFQVIDPLTIRIRTARANVDVPINLSYYQTVIYNADAALDSVETADYTGMYKVVEFVPKRRMVLERNENYWGPKPHIARIIHEEVPDEQSRVLATLSGDAHLAMNIPVTSISQFKDGDRATVQAAPSATLLSVYLNLRRSKFQDVRVRQALSWALDRPELVLLGAEGQTSPVSTWLGANPSFIGMQHAVYPQIDIQKAASLLTEAGWVPDKDGIRRKDGQALNIRLLTWGADKALGEAIQDQWRKLGILTEVQYGEYSLLENARAIGDWDALIEAWSTFGDVHALLRGQFFPGAAANYGGFEDEVINKLLEEMATNDDEATRRAIAVKINERAAELAPIITLYGRPELTAVSTSLDGFIPHFRQFEYVVNADMRFNRDK